MIKIYLYLLVFILIFCSSKRTNQSNDQKNSRETVEKFYLWYIKDAYPKDFSYYQIPPYKKVDQKKYAFDNNEHKARLEKVKYLSKEYINSSLEKLEICNTEMLKLDWDAQPESQFNIRACDYLWFDNWVGGQGEDIDGFRIVNEVASNDRVVFMVEILIQKDVFAKSKVTVKKEDGIYKITNIELIWN
ncbi:hypothetical protein SanaruYs_22050 [Chryseotalea sanaruensis]|uniref:DUF3828 domain-containing protein n=1 Tax=Chryseotalea sanaruensis TaxID=2482724 RepID=A0A401UAU8_9BACT|nr:hypothetical protein [Chryseotalea sanaruensis]GCC51974.1 hypothetical protein SanaruYs_22050 [Chryseotalea sanaruensis]